MDWFQWNRNKRILSRKHQEQEMDSRASEHWPYILVLVVYHISAHLHSLSDQCIKRDVVPNLNLYGTLSIIGRLKVTSDLPSLSSTWTPQIVLISDVALADAPGKKSQYGYITLLCKVTGPGGPLPRFLLTIRRLSTYDLQHLFEYCHRPSTAQTSV